MSHEAHAQNASVREAMSGTGAAATGRRGRSYRVTAAAGTDPAIA
jgi:hypothetical protein